MNVNYALKSLLINFIVFEALHGSESLRMCGVCDTTSDSTPKSIKYSRHTSHPNANILFANYPSLSFSTMPERQWGSVTVHFGTC